MLYIIGLGLNQRSMTVENLEVLKKCKKIYLEDYTVDFPYNKQELEDNINKKIKPVNRDFVESLEFLDESKKLDIALLVYGSPLTATTHITILDEAKKSNIKTKIIHNASIFDAITETGLQLYKFGKIASMPSWKDKGKSSSFIDLIKQNKTIDAHSLILIDIGLDFQTALEQLKQASKEKEFNLNEKDKIVLCQTLGTKKSKIFYRTIEQFSNPDNFGNVRKPFCLIIPGKMHFLEKEILETFS
ncbi:MAG: diphthine synthase [Nanoarchaeota archaeon]